jgi:hypothetical protein
MELAADLVLALHVLFVAFAVLGLELNLAGLVLRWRWVRGRAWRALHLGAVLFVAGRAAVGLPCPLTRWEEALRPPAAAILTTAGEAPLRRLAHRLVLRGEAPERFRWQALGFALLTAALYGVAGPAAGRRQRREPTPAPPLTAG